MKTPTRLRQTIGKPIGKWVISDEDILAIQTDARAELEQENARMREILDTALSHGPIDHRTGKCYPTCPSCRWETLKKEREV